MANTLHPVISRTITETPVNLQHLVQETAVAAAQYFNHIKLKESL